MNPERTYTIEDFINCYNTKNISYESMSLFQNFEYGTMISYNIFNDYIEELNDLCVTVTLSEEEYNRYVYRPKLLAYDIYGSTELFFIVLLMNNICNVKEFDFKKVKLLRVSDLESFISSVYNAEKQILEVNRTKIEGV